MDAQAGCGGTELVVIAATAVLRRSALLSWIAVSGWCMPAAAQTCQQVRAAVIPFRLEGGRMRVDALIDGQPVRLDFDTGSYTTVLSRAAEQRLRLRVLDASAVVGGGIGRAEQLDRVLAAQFSLGALHGTDVAFLARQADSPDDDDGILSADFLSKYDIDLDLIGGRIGLYAPVGSCADQAVAAMAAPLFAVPLITPVDKVRRLAETRVPNGDDDQEPTRTPLVDVVIDGQPAVGSIDTGTGKTIVFRTGEGRPRLDLPGGIARATIAVGELSISNMPVQVVESDRVGHADVILGQDFLSRVHVWVSHSSGTLVMQYPPSGSPAP